MTIAIAFHRSGTRTFKDSDNRLSGFDLLPFDKELGFMVVEQMRAMAAGRSETIAQHRNASVAQIAIAWLVSKSVVSSIIVGASKLHQLEDNLKAAEIKLSDAEVSAKYRYRLESQEA